jgi:hypothetical protein
VRPLICSINADSVLSAPVVRVRRFAAAVLSSGVIACTATPSVYRIVGPDGSPMLHVSCGREQGRCFQLAGERCPNGYGIHTIGPAEHGNFLVRCRPASYAPPVLTAAAPGAPSTYATARVERLPPNRAGPASTPSADTWPPSGESNTLLIHPWQTSQGEATPNTAQPDDRSESADAEAPATPPVTPEPRGKVDFGL